MNKLAHQRLTKTYLNQIRKVNNVDCKSRDRVTD